MLKKTGLIFIEGLNECFKRGQSYMKRLLIVSRCNFLK